MHHYLKTTFFISVLVHAVLLFYLGHLESPPKESSRVEISIQDSPRFSVGRPQLQATEASKMRSGQRTGQKILSHFSKPDFSSAFSAKDRSGITFSDTENYLKNPLEDNPLAEWGSGAGTFDRNKDYLLYRRIYQQVDSILFYPGVLARHRIEGYIHARLVLDFQGNCYWQHTQIAGADPYLRLFVLDMLKQACGQNYASYINGRKRTNVDLSFKFALTEHNTRELVEAEKGIVGNTLLFYRNSQNSIMEWELGPFRGMFPIPVAYLNIPWLQENWDRLVYHREPLEVFKRQFGAQL